MAVSIPSLSQTGNEYGGSPLSAALQPSEKQAHDQLQRILQSAAFHNSHNLQQLLRFLVAQAYSPDPELKEYTIGVEVFGRSPDFDPKTDPSVRVQIHRLRVKLHQYYENAGKHDPVLIDIPKGKYLPVILEVAKQAPQLEIPATFPQEALEKNHWPLPDQSRASTEGQDLFPKATDIRKVLFRVALAGLAMVAIFESGSWFGKLQLNSEAGKKVVAASSRSNSSQSMDPVVQFWTTLLGNDPSPIIAHADAVFLLDSSSDLFRFPHGESDYRGAPVDPDLARRFAANPALVARAGKLYYEDVYLGSGDLHAVAILASLFGRMGLNPIIKAGRDLTSDDFSQHNVILVGSSFQSYAVAQVNTIGDFRFKPSQSSERDWAGQIENTHPSPGEERLYHTERDPVTQVVKADHALISIVPGVVTGRYIVDLGGIDTMGSEGAARFATSKRGLEELSEALTSRGIHAANDHPPVFQALLSVQLQKGNQVLGTSLVTVHPLNAEHATQPAVESEKSSTR